VAISDLETGGEFGFHADRWFHAASTIKVAILVGVFGAIHRGELLPQSRVHVRNRFLSAYDGSPYRVRVDRDANAEVHQAIGRTLRVAELAEHMITSSSNLATNLLLDLVGLDVLQRTLETFGIAGIDLRRGVEDELAFEHGINNRVTARGHPGRTAARGACGAQDR
jgi:beta-lactamase class A